MSVCEEQKAARSHALAAALAGAVGGALCGARLVVAWARGEAPGIDSPLAAVLLAIVVAGFILAARAARSGARRAHPRGGGGRRRSRRYAQLAWQAGFPMHRRHGLPREMHRPASGYSVASPTSRFRQDPVKIVRRTVPAPRPSITIEGS
jgi:hypothetical protein